jgi:uncharacterized protein
VVGNVTVLVRSPFSLLPLEVETPRVSVMARVKKKHQGASVMIITKKVARFSVAGKQVVCSHCGGSEFASQEILMNTRGATFMKLDFLNRAATALACSNCSHIEWFNNSPAETGT